MSTGVLREVARMQSHNKLPQHNLTTYRSRCKANIKQRSPSPAAAASQRGIWESCSRALPLLAGTAQADCQHQWYPAAVAAPLGLLPSTGCGWKAPRWYLRYMKPAPKTACNTQALIGRGTPMIWACGSKRTKHRAKAAVSLLLKACTASGSDIDSTRL
jgi:hypothetical protein